MMEKKLPPYGYALLLIVAALMIGLVAWSTVTPRIYISQLQGTVQSANKTYIMSSYSGQITELTISEGSYVEQGDLIAHIKSTDIDIQQSQLENQLAQHQLFQRVGPRRPDLLLPVRELPEPGGAAHL